ncbi:hypothetical protein MYSEV_016 [Mythimna separata entomopoxvirus 'L']|uniref:Uncharacterized protein n=1 Tax=Mythimna separata entomopoxvirus 'L' TaxID=1293572 RepID=A0A916NYB5_9POXV|nr:hypothetical protein MYSEV_016 [Mythimna separata entomopoxvirus 'L']CCU56214.1 hypothetical protein MYSEV_016 [Mythimna separata entomopoxvirus 'L']
MNIKSNSKLSTMYNLLDILLYIFRKYENNIETEYVKNIILDLKYMYMSSDDYDKNRIIGYIKDEIYLWL